MSAMIAPVLDRYLLVLTELQVFTEGAVDRVVKQSEILEAIDRWIVNECSSGFCTSEDCCDAARLHCLVWGAVRTMTSVERDLFD